MPCCRPGAPQRLRGSRPPWAEQSAARRGGAAAPQRGSVRAEPARRAGPAAERPADFPLKGAGRAAPRCLPRSGTRRTLPWLRRRSGAGRSGAELSLLRAAPCSGSGRCRPGAGSSVPAPPRPVLPGGGRHQPALVPRSSARTASAEPPRAARCPRAVRGGRGPPGGRNFSWRAELPSAAPLSRSRGGPLPHHGRPPTSPASRPALGFPCRPSSPSSCR